MLDHPKSRFLNWIHARRSVSGKRRWHKAMICGPVRLRDGSWSTAGGGQLWRRETEEGWEYEQDDGFEEVDDGE